MWSEISPIRRNAGFVWNGLTLVELLVVLVILIAVAGVVVPMLPNLLTRGHDAAVATNIAEVEKALTGFFTANLAYPDQFDTCMDTSGKIYQGMIWAANNPNGFGNLTFTPVTGTGVPAENGTTAFTASTLQAGEDFSLKFGGITELVESESRLRYRRPQRRERDLQCLLQQCQHPGGCRGAGHGRHARRGCRPELHLPEAESAAGQRRRRQPGPVLGFHPGGKVYDCRSHQLRHVRCAPQLRRARVRAAEQQLRPLPVRVPCFLGQQHPGPIDRRGAFGCHRTGNLEHARPGVLLGRAIIQAPTAGRVRKGRGWKRIFFSTLFLSPANPDWAGVGVPALAGIRAKEPPEGGTPTERRRPEDFRLFRV